MRFSRINNIVSFVGMFSIFCTLVSCSSGGSSGGEPAMITEDTDALVANATRTISSSVGVNMNSIQTTSDNSSLLNSLVDDDENTNDNSDSSSDETDFDTDRAFGHEQTVRDVVEPTVEGGNMQRTRDGNIITIDPDEQFVCQQWSANDFIDNEDIQDCAALLQNLTVSINAETDDSGQLTYRYNDQDLLQIKYSPDAGSYELFLPAVNLVLQRASEIDGSFDQGPEVVEGALRLNANVFSRAFGQESGRMSLEVSQPIRIESATDNLKFEIGSSSSFQIDTDAGEDEGDMSVKIDSMLLSMPDLAGATSDAITSIEIPDFSVNIELTASGDEVLFSDTGFAVPMTVVLDDQLIMSLALANTSMSFNELSDTFRFLENFEFDLQIPDFYQFSGGDEPLNSSISLKMSTDGGTELLLQSPLKVQTGGPFAVEYSYIDGDTNSQGSELFFEGECFDDIPDFNIGRVSCEE